MKKQNMIPLGPAKVSPGEILLEEFIKPMGLTVRGLARKMGCTPMRISEIVRGKRKITAETSLMLSKALGVSPQFWIGIQTDHDLAIAVQKHPEYLNSR